MVSLSVPGPSSKVLVKNFGCKSNWADAAALQQAFAREGLPRVEEGASSVAVCVVNSCTVTEEADRESRREVRRLRKKYPAAKIVFTGCGAEVNQEVAGADWVIGNSSKQALVRQVLDGTVAMERPRFEDTERWPKPSNEVAHPDYAGKTRAFLKVQEGCERFCTYCIIPYGRGPNRGLSVEEILEMLEQTAAQGIPEAVLTGTNLGNLGPRELIELCDGIEKRLKPPFRVRLSSLDPQELSRELILRLNNSYILCAHSHLALQSPLSKILRRMKRGYSEAEVNACFEGVSKFPEMFVGMDLITGFPGETDSDFEATLAKLRGFHWSRLHVFPYSERKGTPALKLKESVPVPVRKERARRLMDLSLERQTSWTSQFLGRTIDDVLVEARVGGPDGSSDWQSGYSRNYLRTLAKGPQLDGHRIEARVATDVFVDRVRQEVSLLAARPVEQL